MAPAPDTDVLLVLVVLPLTPPVDDTSVFLFASWNGESLDFASNAEEVLLEPQGATGNCWFSDRRNPLGFSTPEVDEA